jgi:Ser/Thr protein kinase RdoA (MazF antagonist)
VSGIQEILGKLGIPMNSKLIDRSAELYGISPVQLKPLSGGHSSQVYGFSRVGRDCILRITPPNEELDLPSMQSIMDWMCFLSAHGASVAGPLPSLHGKLVEAFEVDGQGYVLTAFERAKGILAAACSSRRKESKRDGRSMLYQKSLKHTA